MTDAGNAEEDPQQAFDEFYLASRDRLVLQVAALTGDPDEALDHVHEAFVSAWTHWPRIKEYDDPEGWVRRVAHNRAVSRWRRAQRVVLRADVRRHPDAPRIELGAEQQQMIAALRHLRPRERQALVLHHVVGYPVAQVAERMSVPEGTVKSWLSRGRSRLAEVLGTQEASHD